jgi:hypothetical protein
MDEWADCGLCFLIVNDVFVTILPSFLPREVIQCIFNVPERAGTLCRVPNSSIDLSGAAKSSLFFSNVQNASKAAGTFSTHTPKRLIYL